MGREDQQERRGVVVAALVSIVAAVALQSVLHLELALDAHRVGTILDLDRSNGIPDLVSTLALGASSVTAAALWRRSAGAPSAIAGTLVLILALLTVADLFHDGAHPSRPHGLLVIGLAGTASVLLLGVAVGGTRGTRASLALGLLALLGAFVVPGLDRYDQWFERRRGDPVREYQIVVKEDLELIGWSLVALALWYEASRAKHPHRLRLQRELLEDRLHRDDVPLEAELRVGQAGGDADQL